MVGLKRGIVKLVRHQKRWKKAFEVERERLLKQLGKLVIDIQHIGSTSISGIEAKPIIDMSAGIRKLRDAGTLIKPLSRLGYTFYRKSGKQIFFAKGLDKKRTHYLHMMRYCGVTWNNDLLFRTYLRNHPQRAKAYATIKLRLAKRYTNDRKKYTAGKSQFIKETLRLAKKNKKKKNFVNP
ncbi:MAG: GrpB family protein [Candidatus Paceibacterota bacterium]|jgi:GrpB-like predicted nucleotidyltransferase (UPF0157 family)